MTIVWLAYFLMAELLSWMPSQNSSCILISEEASGKNYSGEYPCATMHEAAFRLLRFIWDNANHDNVVAFGTIAVSVFTYTLWRSTNRLWAAGEKQFKLAREEFNATHRPKIIVHSIEFRRISGAEDGVDRIGASILCVNKGRAVAKRVEVRGDILATANIQVDVQRPLIRIDTDVLSGQKLWFEVRSDWPLRELIVRQHANLASFHCVGTIAYWDQSETRRETGYCFAIPTIDARGERWERAKGNEFNYAY